MKTTYRALSRIGTALLILLFGLPGYGDFIVASFGSNQLLLYSDQGQFIRLFHELAGGEQLYHLENGPDNTIYVPASMELFQLSATGTVLNAYSLSEPAYDVAFGANGALLTVGGNPECVRYAAPDYFTSELFGQPGLLQSALAVAVGPNGDIFVADSQGDEVLRYNGTTFAEIGVFGDANSSGNASGEGQLHYPTFLRFGPNGNLFVANYGAGCISEYDGSTGAWIRNYDDSSISLIYGFGFGGDGKLYASDLVYNRVVRFSLDGTFEGEFIEPYSGGLFRPIGIVHIASVPLPRKARGALMILR
jgi:hypothetical protein